MKKIDFEDKLKNLNKNATLNKTKHVLVENELDELSKKVEAIITKGLTKDSINKFGILISSKYFYSGILQNYFAFISTKKYFKYFHATTRIYLWKSNRMSE